MADDQPFGGPFDEAIAFFRQKINQPTERWTDVYAAAHARAFMVAGASTDALVGDFRSAVDAAIADGETLEQFRGRFDDIVQRHGWSYNGSRGWRTRVIYRTNLASAYSAGRWVQQTRPDVLEAFPYLEYQHSDALNPREQHLAWDGLVLRADNLRWQFMYPPNGWGCFCWVISLSDDDLAARGKAGPDEDPIIETQPYVDKVTGEVRDVPVGIDPGFEWNPGLQWVRGEMGGARVPPSPPLSLDAARAYIADALDGGRSAFELAPVAATPARFEDLGFEGAQPAWLSVATIRDDIKHGATPERWLAAIGALDRMRVLRVGPRYNGYVRFGRALYVLGFKRTGDGRLVFDALSRVRPRQITRTAERADARLPGIEIVALPE